MVKKEKIQTQFIVGGVYRLINYETDSQCFLHILKRKGKWLTVQIENRIMEVRAHKVINPYSESILLENYSPVYSYCLDTSIIDLPF